MNAHINLFSHFFVRTVFLYVHVSDRFLIIMSISNYTEERLSDIEAALQCPVCYSIPRNLPISSCSSGHIICQSCRPRVTSCRHAPLADRGCQPGLQTVSSLLLSTKPTTLQVQGPGMRGKNVVERHRTPWIKMSHATVLRAMDAQYTLRIGSRKDRGCWHVQGGELSNYISFGDSPCRV